MNRPKMPRVTTLLGTASLLAMAQSEEVYAAEMVAQADEIPETVLITGSLIRGTAAVGVPVINLSPQDFAMTGTLTTSDLFRTISLPGRWQRRAPPRSAAFASISGSSIPARPIGR